MKDVNTINYVKTPVKESDSTLTKIGLATIIISIVVLPCIYAYLRTHYNGAYNPLTPQNIILCLVAGIGALAVDQHRIKSDKPRTYYVAANTQQYILYIDDTGILFAKKKRKIISILLAAVSSCIFGLLGCLVCFFFFNDILPNRVQNRIPKNCIKNIRYSKKSNIICIEHVLGIQIYLDLADSYNKILDVLDRLEYPMLNPSIESGLDFDKNAASDIKHIYHNHTYAQAHEKRHGKRTLIYGIILSVTSIVWAVVYFTSAYYFNNPEFTIALASRFLLIVLCFIIGVIFVIIGIYKTLNVNETTQAYRAKIKDNISQKCYTYVVSINENDLIYGRKSNHFIILGVCLWLFGALFGYLIFTIIDTLLPYKLHFCVSKSWIKNIKTSAFTNTTRIETISGMEILFDNAKDYKEITSLLERFGYFKLNQAKEIVSNPVSNAASDIEHIKLNQPTTYTYTYINNNVSGNNTAAQEQAEPPEQKQSYIVLSSTPHIVNAAKAEPEVNDEKQYDARKPEATTAAFKISEYSEIKRTQQLDYSSYIDPNDAEVKHHIDYAEVKRHTDDTEVKCHTDDTAEEALDAQRKRAKKRFIIATIAYFVSSIIAVFLCQYIATMAIPVARNYCVHFENTVTDFYGNEYRNADQFDFAYTVNSEKVTNGQNISLSLRSSDALEFRIHIKNKTYPETKEESRNTFSSNLVKDAVENNISLSRTSHSNIKNSNGIYYAKITTEIKLTPTADFCIDLSGYCIIGFIIFACIGLIVVIFFYTKYAKYDDTANVE